MSKKGKKRKQKTALEFITEVADDCVANLKEEDKEQLISNPCAIDYHFSYCLYIRNHYIHNTDLSDLGIWIEPDDLSSEIIKMVFSKLLPEYEYDNLFIETLYNDKRFIKLRQEYKAIYGEYPVDLVEAYQNEVDVEHVISIVEFLSLDKKRVALASDYKKYIDWINKLVEELAEKVWRTDSLRQTAEECGIDFEELKPKIQEIKSLLFAENEYIPMETCLLSYKNAIGQERYIQYREQLARSLEQNPRLVEKLAISYFDDRDLAKSVLKYGWTLDYLPQYQDDEEMVEYCIFNEGEAIEYASERFQKDREWVKLAVSHSTGNIMHLDCMKPYRKDKELVYMACKISASNFLFVDESYRDDYDLAKMCIEQTGNLNSIYCCMSERLKDNKELAMLDLQKEYPHVEEYSSRLRDNDRIAAELFRLHGSDSWGWHYMSKRLREKYNIKRK